MYGFRLCLQFRAKQRNGCRQTILINGLHRVINILLAGLAGKFFGYAFVGGKQKRINCDRSVPCTNIDVCVTEAKELFSFLIYVGCLLSHQSAFCLIFHGFAAHSYFQHWLTSPRFNPLRIDRHYFHRAQHFATQTSREVYSTLMQLASR